MAGNVDRLVETRLCEFKTSAFSSKQCPVCSAQITDESLVLEFGKAYVRRRAFFDGVDCLEYFINTQLKQESSRDSENQIN
ncbi:MAG: hypothetical protein ACLFN8_04660 [Candidatus Woesearchaeota archaeon]